MIRPGSEDDDDDNDITVPFDQALEDFYEVGLHIANFL